MHFQLISQLQKALKSPQAIKKKERRARKGRQDSGGKKRTDIPFQKLPLMSTLEKIKRLISLTLFS